MQMYNDQSLLLISMVPKSAIDAEHQQHKRSKDLQRSMMCQQQRSMHGQEHSIREQVSAHYEHQ
jgi:hypothetical protein